MKVFDREKYDSLMEERRENYNRFLLSIYIFDNEGMSYPLLPGEAGNELSFELDYDRYYYYDNPHEFFDGNLQEIVREASNLRDLCKRLTYAAFTHRIDESIEDDTIDGDGEFIDDDNSFVLLNQRDEFLDWEADKYAELRNNVIRNIKEIKNISKIVVSRTYEAAGHYIESCPFLRDTVLWELARYVVKSTGNAKEIAKKNLLARISSTFPNFNTDGEFGYGMSEISYRWNGDDEDLEMLAQSLFHRWSPDSVNGVEVRQYDMQTGTYMERAEFELTFGEFGLI